LGRNRKVAKATRAKMMPMRSQVFFAGEEARVWDRRRKRAERRKKKVAIPGEISCGFILLTQSVCKPRPSYDF
jgi:hypothetical protein